jgi:hypothetical protein
MSSRYPRWTNLAFLEFCHPRIRALYEYWMVKRGVRNMPSRTDIDPLDLPSYLPGIVMVDVEYEPFSLIYRLVGTREAEARGQDPTGRSVFEAWDGRSLEDVLENYRQCIARKGPLYDADRTLDPERNWLEAGTVFLPLSDDGETVNKILIYTEYKDRKGS